MQSTQPSLIAREHTFFGVCEGLGEDLGFNPVWLRIAFGTGVIFSPAVVLAIYAGLGVAVFGSRMLFPKPRAAEPVESPATPILPAAKAEAEIEREPMLLAA